MDGADYLVLAIGVLAGGGILIGMITTITRQQRKRRLLEHGVAAAAVITALSPYGPVHNAARVKVDVTLTVTPPDGLEPFESRTTEEFPITALPSVGWTVPVRYSARDHWQLALAGPATEPTAH
jgi:hypothetical protein